MAEAARSPAFWRCIGGPSGLIVRAVSVGSPFRVVREGAAISTRQAALLVGLTESAYIALECDKRACTELECRLVTQAFASLIVDSGVTGRVGTATPPV